MMMRLIKKYTLNEDGFTLIEVTLIIIIAGILSLMAYVRYIDLKESTERSVCIANQSSIETCINIYLGQNLTYPEDISELAAYMPSNTLPICPNEGNYVMDENYIISCSLPEHSR